MKINRKKSGIIFHLKKRKKIDPETAPQVKGFPVKMEYKYLGIYLDQTMRLDKQLDEVKRKVGKGMKMICIM